MVAIQTGTRAKSLMAVLNWNARLSFSNLIEPLVIMTELRLAFR